MVHQLFFQNDGTANGVVFVGRLSPVKRVTSLSLSLHRGHCRLSRSDLKSEIDCDWVNVWFGF